MEPELFSFSKKPIEPPTQHRYSVISSRLPSESGSNKNSLPSDTNVPPNDRSFSSSSQGNALVDANMMADDPLLDYNQQIRAPKFKQQTNQDNIGESLDKATISNGDKFSDLIRVKTEPNVNKNYQPAEVDVSRIKSALSSSTGHQEQSIYSIDDFLQHVTKNQATHLINNLNLDYTHTDNSSTENSAGSTSSNTTSNTSPISSKKPSHESINYNFIESTKQPRFNPIPIKQIDELKTPNYLPCVLRTPLYNHKSDDSSFAASNLSKVKSYSLIEDQSDITYKAHWKPNNSRSQCLDCEKPFSLMNRRHHCRKCGEIFCGNCLVFKAKLQYNEAAEVANFDATNGITCKVCFQCGKNWSDFLFKEFKENEEQTSPLYSNLKGLAAKDSSLSTNSPRPNEQLATPVTNTTNINGSTNELVPADWSWSSF